MKRGDIVIVALSGDLGKPRPAVIVETDRLAPTDHVLVCPGTSQIRQDVEQRRIQVESGAATGLREQTQFQIDKLTIVRRSKCASVIGRLDSAQMERLNATLALVLGLID